MYSIFLHDNFANKVYLINDIFGEKPLYYTLQDGVLIFSSELKSLKIVPNIKQIVSAKFCLNTFSKKLYSFTS